MRIGIRAHDFGKLPADELARRIAAKGLSCVQLAVNKAIEGIDLSAGEMTPGLAWHVGQAFQRHAVQIAVLGCYINPIFPDLQKRAELIRFFKDHLRWAKDFGCSIVGLETGSVNPDYSPHPDNQGEPAFNEMLKTIGLLVEEAERMGVIVCIEGVTWHTVSTPRKMRRALDAIKSDNLQVIFDPVNLISFENHAEQDRIVKESLDLFGDRIAIIHAKDFRIENGALKQVRSGQGQLNYPPLMKWLAQHKPCISILLEESGESTAEECFRFLNGAMG